MSPSHRYIQFFIYILHENYVHNKICIILICHSYTFNTNDVCLWEPIRICIELRSTTKRYMVFPLKYYKANRMYLWSSTVNNEKLIYCDYVEHGNVTTTTSPEIATSPHVLIFRTRVSILSFFCMNSSL